MRVPHRPLLARLLALIPAGLVLCAQAAAPIAIDDAQLRQSGVEFQPAQAASQSGGSLRLPGVAVYPAGGLQLVSAPAAGVVREILVQPMQAVTAGTPVIRLYSAQLLDWQRDYLQERSKLALTTDKLQRDQALFDEGIIARSRLEESRSQQQQARAALEAARQVLRLAGMSPAALVALKSAEGLSAELAILAGSAGGVAEQLVNIGQRVEAGTPLLRLARGGDLLVELQAGRAEAERISTGDSVRVDGCESAGRVVAKGSQINPANQTLSIRASIPGSVRCLRPNQHVQAELGLPAAAAAKGSSVPLAAVVRQGDRDYVFVREAGGARPVAVTVVGRQGDRALVQGELAPGANVAVKGTAVLKGIWAGLGREGAHN